jgi:hypothetical protein
LGPNWSGIFFLFIFKSRLFINKLINSRYILQSLVLFYRTIDCDFVNVNRNDSFIFQIFETHKQCESVI